MLLRYLALKVLFLFSTVDCFAQLVPEGWFQQSSPVSTTLNSVYFLNSNTGWSVGNNGVILWTANGGLTWQHQESSVLINLEKVVFSSPNTGYIIGASGTILKTTNSGSNWYTQKSSTTNNLTSVSFIYDNTGFVTGLNQTLLKTTTGGINWYSLSFDDSVNYYSVYFINSFTGWLSSVKYYTLALDSAFISKTTNGGESWFYQHSRWNDFTPNLSLQFIDSLNGWCTWQIPTISASEVLKTTDGGNSWLSYGGFDGDNYRLFFINNLKGWCSGAANNIYRTVNGGINWIRANSFHTLSFFYRSVYFTDSLTGWTVGYEGTILKTTTGGVLTGFSTTSSEIPDRYYLSQNYPNPFNPVTNLEFGISNLGFVSLKVYDVSGKEIKTLVNEIKQPGIYKVEFDGSSLASGIYFYTIEAGSFLQTKRMLLLK